MTTAKEHKLGKYTLTYDMNALCAAEEQVGPLPALMVDPVRAGSVKTIRSLVWAGLIRKHDVDMNEAGDIIDEVGLALAAKAVQDALQKAYPQKSGDGEGKPTAG